MRRGRPRAEQVRRAEKDPCGHARGGGRGSRGSAVRAGRESVHTIGITNTNPETRANGQIRGGWTVPGPGPKMPASKSIAIRSRRATAAGHAEAVPIRMPDTTGERGTWRRSGPAVHAQGRSSRSRTRLHWFGATADGSGGGPMTLRFSDGSTETATVSFRTGAATRRRRSTSRSAASPAATRPPAVRTASPCAILPRDTTISAANAAKT